MLLLSETQIYCWNQIWIQNLIKIRFVVETKALNQKPNLNQTWNRHEINMKTLSSFISSLCYRFLPTVTYLCNVICLFETDSTEDEYMIIKVPELLLHITLTSNALYSRKSFLDKLKLMNRTIMPGFFGALLKIWGSDVWMVASYWNRIKILSRIINLIWDWKKLFLHIFLMSQTLF